MSSTETQVYDSSTFHYLPYRYFGLQWYSAAFPTEPNMLNG
jgi:hypothetical protein